MQYGIETKKLFEGQRWPQVYQYFKAPGCDIGYDGGVGSKPFLDFEGWDLGTPGYDGLTIPRADEHYQTVYSSHCLEHLDEPIPHLREWFRVLRTGGHLFLAVPHQFLYEKKANLPSLWNETHKRFYTPASLLGEIEAALKPNSYRVISLRDNADGFDYTLGPKVHSGGSYEVELILQKIPQPTWELL